MKIGMLYILALSSLMTIQTCKNRNTTLSEVKAGQHRQPSIEVATVWARRVRDDLQTAESNAKQLHNKMQALLDVDLNTWAGEAAKTQQRNEKLADITQLSDTAFSHLRGVLLKLRNKLKNPQLRASNVKKVITITARDFNHQVQKLDDLISGPVLGLETFFGEADNLSYGEYTLKDFGQAMQSVEKISTQVAELVKTLDGWLASAIESFRPAREVPIASETIIPYEINACIGGAEAEQIRVFSWDQQLNSFRQRPELVSCGVSSAFVDLPMKSSISRIEIFATAKLNRSKHRDR